jgi:hypothetical protein
VPKGAKIMSTMNGYFDITDYHHTGDIDYTAAVIRAEQACESAGGGVIYFPPGTWPLSGTQAGFPLPIEIGKSGVQWRGAGAGVSLIVGAISGAPQLTFVNIGGSIQLVTIEDIGFVGNGYAVVGSIAEPMIQFAGGAHHKVINCYFTSASGEPNTTGVCISLTGVTDGEVAGCRFYNYGFVDKVHGTTVHTDAVFIDQTSVGVRVRDNHIENGGLGGINNQQSGTGPGPGGWCDLSHNFATNVWGGAVILHNFDTRAALNDTSYTHTVPFVSGAGSQNIDVGQPKVFALIGNLASYCDGDGIATNGYPSGTLIGNLCWDNEIVGNDCGLQFLGQSGHSNLGAALIGNMCFDDGPGTQQMGIHLYTTDNAYSTFCSVIGNATYGNNNKDTGADQGIFENLVNANILTRDDSNAILANNDWPERLHQVAKAPVSPTTLTLLRDVSTPSRYMLTQCGIRVTAGGAIIGNAGAKTFQLGFATSPNNIFSVTVPKNVGTWSFVAVITNNQDRSDMQAATAHFCAGTAVLGVFEVALGFDTVVPDRVVELWVSVDNSSDSIRSDYFNIERC